MQYGIGQARETLQAAPVVEVARDRNRPGRTQRHRRVGLAHQGEDAESARQPRQGAERDVATAHDQNSFHIFILSHAP